MFKFIKNFYRKHKTYKKEILSIKESLISSINFCRIKGIFTESETMDLKEEIYNKTEIYLVCNSYTDRNNMIKLFKQIHNQILRKDREIREAKT